MTSEYFTVFLIVMSVIAAIVFVALYFVDAGYGLFFDRKWGTPVPNKVAWMCMEAPVFVVVLLLWADSDRRFEVVPLLFFLFFELHYFRRSFVFPWLIKGKSMMPAGIMAMGIVFNLLNGYMQGEWLFHLAPADRYTTSWLVSPQFIIGTALFFLGMAVNWHSDYIVRHLRKGNDTKHYLPKGGMFKYVTSAGYLGEIVEWCGFAVLTWSASGAVFAWWTFANLVPRANTVYHKYQKMFGSEVENKKRVFPFIY
jgi:3-oxo-5-alpha-steroid 4-dehydrogenase 1